MKTLEISYLSSTAQQLWSRWNIRVFVLFSLLLQWLLVLCASERIRTNKAWLVTLIFSAYYIADWVAPFTIGLMSSSNLQGSCDPAAVVINVDLLAFWAPFLLLHLGGPDNVISLSATENDQWRQNSSRLFAQMVSAVIIYIQSLPNKPFFWASWMVFMAGAIKVAERALSLRSASLKRPKYSKASLITLDNYEKLIETQLAMREANLQIQAERVQLEDRSLLTFAREEERLDFNIICDQLGDRSLLIFARFFYNQFKELFTGNVKYGNHHRKFSRRFFSKRSSHDAFKLMEIELSFLYEDLHTKVATRILTIRFATLGLVAAATHSFSRYDMKGLSKIDIGISYILLAGSLILEIVYLLLALFSGRSVFVWRTPGCGFWVRVNFGFFKPIANAIINIRRMWSESFFQCNLISHCLHHRTPLLIRMLEILHIGPLREGMKLEIKFSSSAVSKSLKEKIFRELCTRSKLAHKVETATMICSQRGDWAVMQKASYCQLKWSLGEVEYGHSLLIWHIATDLLLHDINYSKNDASFNEHQLCKEISGYMLYLLLMKPTMIAPVAGNWVKIFWDTSLEAKRLFDKRRITEYKQACEAILSVDTTIKPVILKGDASASVLFDACRLAKQLLEFDEDNRWSLLIGVWMELLAFAAFHCEGPVHAQNPSQGGELLTFVWLLMNHLGLGKQFHEEPVCTRYKVDVKK